MPEVSVILTSHNHAKYLRESIESVLDQTYSDFELIIVDDCSSDNSWEIIQSYKDDRIVAIKNSQNVIHVLNDPISNVAKGKYIAVHHSDDIWEPEKLQKQVDFLERNPEYGAVFTWAKIIDEKGKEFFDESHFYCRIFKQPNRTRFEWLYFFFYEGNALCHPSILIRSDCYKKIGLYEYGFFQLGDFLMWIKLCFEYEIYVMPENLIRFRIRSGELNTSGNRLDTRVRSAIELFILLNRFLAITSQDIFLAIFPERNDLVRPTGFIPEYALAMVSLGAGANKIYNLFGMQLLFNIMLSKQKRQELEDIYGFTYRDFINLTSQYDVFGVNDNGSCIVSLYIDTGNGLNEVEKITKCIAINSTINSVRFDLREYKNIVGIRFDPIEGCPCACKIIRMISDAKDVEFKAINAEYSIEDEHVFLDIDPRIELKGEFANASFIEIIYTFRILETSEIVKKYKRMKQNCNDIKAEYEYAKNQLDAIYSSRGWKVLKKFYNLRDTFLFPQKK